MTCKEIMPGKMGLGSKSEYYCILLFGMEAPREIRSLKE